MNFFLLILSLFPSISISRHTHTISEIFPKWEAVLRPKKDEAGFVCVAVDFTLLNVVVQNFNSSLPIVIAFPVKKLE